MEKEAVIALINALEAGRITPEQARAHVAAGLSAEQVKTLANAEKPYYGPG
ncbi:hypothetical protein [Deinococcus multiflagellatus]|uniref:Anthranilate phosphoribosyltransferase n=1 Tax=Deinococcus multiflagellatus TaxID=1656887 RepID=A0ABW1ZFV7_9DEIO|nr:hypothetical protein [Deinococcus multiflagellatus]MBZ9712200.1 hypothetical protein [Deinococcus multiflagellatus]